MNAPRSLSCWLIHIGVDVSDGARDGGTGRKMRGANQMSRRAFRWLSLSRRGKHGAVDDFRSSGYSVAEGPPVPSGPTTVVTRGRVNTFWATRRTSSSVTAANFC